MQSVFTQSLTAHLDPMKAPAGQVTNLLMTTREAKITDVQKYDLDVMTPDEAMALLTSKLDTPLTEEETVQAGDFAKRVGYLPLALELATVQIDEGLTWEELLTDFCEEMNRLELLDSLSENDEPDETKRRKFSLVA